MAPIFGQEVEPIIVVGRVVAELVETGFETVGEVLGGPRVDLREIDTVVRSAQRPCVRVTFRASLADVIV